MGNMRAHYIDRSLGHYDELSIDEDEELPDEEEGDDALGRCSADCEQIKCIITFVLRCDKYTAHAGLADVSDAFVLAHATLS